MKKLIEVSFGLWSCYDSSLHYTQYLASTKKVRFTVDKHYEIEQILRQEFKKFVDWASSLPYNYFSYFLWRLTQYRLGQSGALPYS